MVVTKNKYKANDVKGWPAINRPVSSGSPYDERSLGYGLRGSPAHTSLRRPRKRSREGGDRARGQCQHSRNPRERSRESKDREPSPARSPRRVPAESSRREVSYVWRQQQSRSDYKGDGRRSDGDGQPYQDQHVYRCECNGSPVGTEVTKIGVKGLQT
ncbi:hypothetical protein PoB_003444900 [Plakobranchus ocellatus]|uniref:Uncharacterized protein n=1 Tax=Plakobranchus ocellatus TaxID=259542 RepID=A0AAV4ANN9_9GAST|nr:hypothetical protein PoB_003444900 [Plakobranchus ocellatus]